MRRSVYPQGKLYDNETIHRENTVQDKTKHYEETQQETGQTNTTDKVNLYLLFNL